MSDFEFIFCRWQGRLWPARILLKSGISPSGTPETNSDCVDVQIICLDKRLRVKCTDTRPFEEEQAKTISSGLVYREHFTHEETLEELTYRKALRIALNILAGDDSHLPPMTIKEPVIANTGIFTSEKLKKNACAFNSNGTQTALKPNGLHLPQEQGSICTRQSHRRASCIKNTPENEQTRTWTRSYTLNQSSINLRSIAEKSGGGCVEKRKRGRVKTDICHPQKNTSKNSSPQYEQPLQPMKSTPEKNRSSVKKRERLRKEEKSSIHACSPTVSGVKKDQNGKVKKSRQKSKVCKSTPEGNTDYCPSNCKSEEVWASGISCSYLESTPKRGTCDHVGSHKFPRLLRSQRNIPFEKKNDLSQTREIKQNKKRGKKCAEPMECLNASETSADLDANVKSSNEPNVDSFAEQGSPEQHFMSTIFGLPLDEQVSPINGCNQKHSNMDSPHTNCSTAEISKEDTFNASSITKEEGTLSSTLLQTHLGSSLFEIDEVGIQSSLLSVEFSTPDCLSTSPFTEEVMEEKEEEDDENLPSILVHQEQWSVAEGMLVWCKFQKYPHWPAMVRSVKNRTKKASILFVDENIIKVERNKKGFNVSIRTLKPFDCEERHQFTAAARQVYKNSIDWCVALIDDYRIRRGCGSFTGSFVEYCTAELSIPVRKSFKQDPSLMTFPSSSIASQVEGHSDAEYDTTPTRQQPTKKLLPDRKKAARDRANEKLVQFIVKARGVEKHLQAVMKGEKYSKWLEEFKTRTRNSNVIDTYLEDDWQVDKVINYLKSIYEMSASTEVLVHYERSRFILDVLLPEAIICAIAEVEQISIKKAEEKYMKGPLHSEREVEHFNKEIEKEMKLKQQHLNEEESTS